MQTKRYSTYVLGVDPGETTGFCLLRATLWEPEDDGRLFTGRNVHVLEASQPRTPTLEVTLDEYAQRLGACYPLVTPLSVAVEDYRVYSGMGDLHTGVRLYVPEQIGAILGYTMRCHPAVEIFKVAAQCKQRWADARLDQWEDEGLLTFRVKVPKPHGWDAMKLALVLMEMRRKVWLS